MSVAEGLFWRGTLGLKGTKSYQGFWNASSRFNDDAAAGVDTAIVASSIGLLAERHAIDLLELFTG
jgi:hypothetical protein